VFLFWLAINPAHPRAVKQGLKKARPHVATIIKKMTIGTQQQQQSITRAIIPPIAVFIGLIGAIWHLFPEYPSLHWQLSTAEHLPLPLQTIGSDDLQFPLISTWPEILQSLTPLSHF